MSNYNIGSRVKRLRLESGLSQEQLALKSDITTVYLGQIERNEKNPTVKLVERIANALGLSLSEFFDDRDRVAEHDKILNSIIFELKDLSDDEKSEMLKLIRQVLKFKVV
ncbi:MAG: helix-turn-helix transcriptional regulator [Oscillospiraceae bacterium]|nr:helix-turn-helix transcriptional regulator [Oscillospiraceae bacterium]